MIKQKVVRTYQSRYESSTEYLEEALEEGYKVKHITKLDNGAVEYIVEIGEGKSFIMPTYKLNEEGTSMLREQGIVEMGSLAHNKTDATNYIVNDLDVKVADKTLVRAVLNSYERYMRNIMTSSD